MRTLFRATAILGSASVINIGIGVVSAKVTAVLLGPTGFGLMALLQSVISFATMIAGLGTQAGLVREGARVVSDGNIAREAALNRACWLIGSGMGLAAVLVMIGFRTDLGRIALGDPGYRGWIVVIAPAVLLSLWAGVQGSILNARRRVGDLARISVLSAALSLLPTITLVWLFRRDGVAPAVAANFLMLWLVSRFFYRSAMREDRRPSPPPSRAAVHVAARDLLGFGIPYTGSMLVGAGVLMLLPVLVLHALGPAEVGMFRAASAIAINYLAVLLTAMAQDYFPRVAGAPDDPATVNRIINDQLRLILLIGGPVIIAMLAAVPYLVRILYSSQFAGAVELLEWQLVGDLFKFATWTMSFVIMARLSGRIFFLTELAAGGVLLGASWIGMKAWGLPGLGIAFVIAGAFGFVICWTTLRHHLGLRWTGANVILFLSLATALAAIRVLPALGLEHVRTPVAGLLALAFGGYSLSVIWTEFGGWTGIRKWDRAR